MNILASHIDYLIRHRDCVIIPGIGALIATREGARVDEVRQCIIPPRRHVSFNSNIVNNDGLLAWSISRRERLSYEEALHLLDSYVEGIRNALKTDGEVALGRVGTLHSGPEQTLSFTPGKTAEETTDRLGLYEIEICKRAQKSAALPAAASVPNEGFDRSKNYYIAINKRFARAAAVAAIVIMTAVTLLIPSANEPRQMDHASVVPVSVAEKVEKKLNPARANTEMRLNEPQNENNQASRAESTAMEINADASLLVVGAFATEQEAESFIRQHEKSDFRLSTAKVKRYTYVVAGSAPTAEELKRITSQPGFYKEFPQAWIRR